MPVIGCLCLNRGQQTEVDPMLTECWARAQWRRRWANDKRTSDQRLVFAGEGEGACNIADPVNCQKTANREQPLNKCAILINLFL